MRPLSCVAFLKFVCCDAIVVCQRLFQLSEISPIFVIAKHLRATGEEFERCFEVCLSKNAQVRAKKFYVLW